MAREPGSIDATFLLAVAQPLRRRVRLSSAIGRFDFIDHSIPTREQVEGAVRRLSAKGLLEVDGERLRVSPRTRALLRATRGGALHDQVRRLESAIRALPAPSDIPGSELPEGEYDRATEAYLRRQGYFKNPS